MLRLISAIAIVGEVLAVAYCLATSPVLEKFTSTEHSEQSSEENAGSLQAKDGVEVAAEMEPGSAVTSTNQALEPRGFTSSDVTQATTTDELEWKEATVVGARTTRNTRRPRIDLDLREIDWCTATTCGDIHVLCRFPNPGISPNCINYTSLPMSETAKVYITSAFNLRRNSVAGGFEYKLPPAAYMMKLKWDDTLETFAQRWIDQCVYDPYMFIADFEKPPVQGSCRDHPDFRVAQLSIRLDGVEDATVVDLLNLMITYMSSSNPKFTEHVLKSGYVPVEDQGAVLLHSNAHKIGCAAAVFHVSARKGFLAHRLGQMYCNIGPIVDLYLLDRYYEIGPPCSKCPSGTGCRKKWTSFKNLCEYNEDLENEAYMTHNEYIFSSESTQCAQFLLELAIIFIPVIVFHM